MRYAIKEIDLETLLSMESILSASAGYKTNLQEEGNYFSQQLPTGWFVARDGLSRQVAFIRSFRQSDEWSSAELYVDPKIDERGKLAKELLNTFFRENIFLPGHRVRFEIRSSDEDVNSAIEGVERDHKKQTFHFFELSISHELSCSKKSAPKSHSAQAIAEVLSHLHPVTKEESQRWLDNGTLRFQEIEGCLGCVAQVHLYDTSAEIVRIATHQDFRRQGLAKDLVLKIINELGERKISKLFLKVEDVKKPAIHFYKNFGFNENLEEQQTWHSLS